MNDFTSTSDTPAMGGAIHTAPIYVRHTPLSVFPTNRNKSPRTQHGFFDASRDLDQTIPKWTTQHPDAGIAARTGDIIAPGRRVLVGDLDSRNGGSFEGLEIPKTWRTITPNGEHVWFSYDADLDLSSGTNRLGQGLDLKAAGGYVILPPSVHPSGKRYAWAPGCAPWEIPLAPAPQWVISRALTSKRDDRVPLTGRDWVTLLDALVQGNRDEGLLKIGGLLFHTLPAALAAELVHAINQLYCKPKMSKSQAEKICRSLARRELRSFEDRRGAR